MLEVNIYDKVPYELLKFAVIITKANGKWVFCKHKERDTYEVPGGHRELGESIIDTAKRELAEETGAIEFDIKPICVYSVKGKTRVNENENDEIINQIIKDINYQRALTIPFKVVYNKDGVQELVTNNENYSAAPRKYYVGALKTKLLEDDISRILNASK